ncbi:MAG: response regulator [Thermodesulfobacteriota bacterium]|nr:MAG: response regulator [Thermodesulfobacteriota bacterium]
MVETRHDILKDTGKRTARILVVDDDRFFLEVLKDLVMEMGHEAVTAENGAEAFEKAVSLPPDIVITDVLMPVMDGFELTEKLKDRPGTSHTPVIIVTSLSDKASRIKGLKAGADELLSKPIDEAEFRVRVGNLLKVKRYEDYLIEHGKTLEGEIKDKSIQLEEAYEQIRSSYLETVYRLTLAAEYRDMETGAHIKRIGLYSRLVAEKLGLGDKEVDALYIASPMHDVGKIGIPDSVLLKHGKFTDDEFYIMKTHCAIGANILHNPGPELLKTAMDIALTHHERWDGSGYPGGLKGTEIPLSGRIVQLVDVYDALRSERPYKEAFDHQKALDIIGNDEKDFFDPEIFRILMDNAGSFDRIFEENLT